MDEMQNQEIVKEVVEEFSRIQQWMLLADKDSAVYFMEICFDAGFQDLDINK